MITEQDKQRYAQTPASFQRTYPLEVLDKMGDLFAIWADCARMNDELIRRHDEFHRATDDGMPEPRM